MEKLETLCLKNAMKLGLINSSTSSEIIPKPLMVEIKNIEQIKENVCNGAFYKETGADAISCIEIQCHGETMKLTMKNTQNQVAHSINLCRNKKIIVDNGLLYFVYFDPSSEISYDIVVKTSNLVLVTLSLEDPQWMWNLIIEIE